MAQSVYVAIRSQNDTMRKLWFGTVLLILASCNGAVEENTSGQEEISEWARMQSNYKVISGQELFADSTLNIEVDRRRGAISFKFEVELGEDYSFPVLDGKTANHFRMDVDFGSIDTTFSMRNYDGKPRNVVGRYVEILSLDPAELAQITEGETEFIVSGNAWLTTEDKSSNSEPLWEFEISQVYDVPAISRSTIFFEKAEVRKSQKVTEESQDGMLESGTPDTGIGIYVNGNFVLNRFVNASYILEEDLQQTFYHEGLDDVMHILIFDADKGFNKRDDLCSKDIPLVELISDEMLDVDMNCTEHLILRCETEGQLNAR